MLRMTHAAGLRQKTKSRNAMAQLKCESCGAPLELTAADRAAGSYRCKYCDSVM
jgi:DNA-directed RNA polymerase subunit RPC12/RpoP